MWMGLRESEMLLAVGKASPEVGKTRPLQRRVARSPWLKGSERGQCGRRMNLGGSAGLIKVLIAYYVSEAGLTL